MTDRLKVRLLRASTLRGIDTMLSNGQISLPDGRKANGITKTLGDWVEARRVRDHRGHRVTRIKPRVPFMVEKRRRRHSDVFTVTLVA